MTLPGDLAQAWAATGFNDVVEVPQRIRIVFDSVKDCWAYCLCQDGSGAEYVATLGDAERIAHPRCREA